MLYRCGTRRKEGAALFERAITIFNRALGPAHPAAISARANRARLVAEAPCQEQFLAQAGTVTIAGPFRLVRKVESLLGFAEDYIDGLLLEATCPRGPIRPTTNVALSRG